MMIDVLLNSHALKHAAFENYAFCDYFLEKAWQKKEHVSHIFEDNYIPKNRKK